VLLLNQRTLFLLNVRDFIYVFVESMIFVVVMYGYYVLLKRKESASDEPLFLLAIFFVYYKCYSWVYV